RSRPWRKSCTRPASASTCKCLVTAWRVMVVPAVSCAIDSAPPAHSATTSRSRVASPSAANTGALADNAAALRRERSVRGDIFLDVAHLHGPATGVGAQCGVAARGRQPVEAGLGESQHDALGQR